MFGAARIRTALLSAIAVMTGIFFVLFLGTTNFNSPIQYGIVQLDKGWTVSRGRSTWKTDSLQNSNIGITNDGDSIIITRKLPMSNIFPGTISFRTVLSSVEVFLDDRLIYSFGEEFVSSGKMLPKMEHFVPLPDDYPEKEIMIVITAHDNKAFSGLSPVYFGNYNDIKNSLVQGSRFTMIIGVYLCHLGFMLIILAPFLAFSENHDFSIFFSALTSVFMGIYILCYSGIFWYLSDDPPFFTFIEYFSLFMIPAVTCGFIATSESSRYKKMDLIMLCINLIFALGTSALHLTNIIHICRFVWVLHLIAVTEGIILIVSLGITAFKPSNSDNKFRIRSTSRNILVFGLILVLACSVFEIIRFNVMKFMSSGEMNIRISFMTIGALIFVMCLLLNYFFQCIEYINETTIKVQLEGIAYTDALTGLSNRARCEQVLTGLRGEYTIISLDLDYLKYTNDNYGHDKGDGLLSGFADILRNSFTDASLIGRMGGDEFIVALPYVDEERVERSLRGFQDNLAYRNSQESHLRFSASWGYASSNDKELKGNEKAQNVYLLADTRMYQMKSKHHRQSLGRLYDDLLNKMTEGGKQL